MPLTISAHCFSPTGFVGGVSWLLAAALVLGGCARTQPSASVPKPPVLADFKASAGAQQVQPPGQAAQAVAAVPSAQAVPPPQLAPAPPQPAAARPAQSTPASVPSSAGGAQQSLRALLRTSDAVVRLIDAGQMKALWAETAPFVHSTSKAEVWLPEISRVRQNLGEITGRSRQGVDGVQLLRFGAQSQRPPPGDYANVEYSTRLTDGLHVVERLSFKQEGENWRFIGYTTRHPAPEELGGVPAAAAVTSAGATGPEGKLNSARVRAAQGSPGGWAEKPSR